MATYIELKQQIEELQKQAESLRATERQGVIDRMKEAIAVYDISAQELGLAPGRRQTSQRAAGKKTVARRSKTSGKQGAPRSAFADGNGNTWGGRGPRPKWLKDALAGGARLEEFAQN